MGCGQWFMWGVISGLCGCRSVISGGVVVYGGVIRVYVGCGQWFCGVCIALCKWYVGCGQ